MLAGLLNSPNMPSPRPALDDRFESNVPGLYVVGDLAGAPVVKLAMEQGHQVAREIAGGRRSDPDFEYDLLVIGAGAAGLNAALTAKQAGLRVVVLEKREIGATVAGLPEGKWIYTEPRDRPTQGPLWLEEATKEEVVRRWREQVRAEALDVRENEPVTAVRPHNPGFTVVTGRGAYRARRIVLAIGKNGSPRRLGVPGEELPFVQHRLYNPNHYAGETALVVGGGNSAVEAAVALARASRVILSYRGESFARASKENRRRLEEAVGSGNLEIVYQSEVERFAPDRVVLRLAKGNGEHRSIAIGHAFVLVGSEPPVEFLRSIGVKLENDWTGSPWVALGLTLGVLFGLGWSGGAWATAGAGLAALGLGGLLWQGFRGSRWAWLGFSFLLSYTVYGAKQGSGHEFWPFTGWGYRALSFFDRPWSFWYTVLYTVVMTVFGIPAMKRWGLDRGDRFQIWRFASLIGFQWIFFFLIPEFLFQWAVKGQWLGSALSSDPNFANNAWRSYGLVYAWPLFFYTFFDHPHQVWTVWGAVLSFGIIPLLVLLHGKRYCTWICGCGGLAETLGDRWRHLAPKGRTSIRWERMNAVVLAVAVVVTVLMLGKDVVTAFREPAQRGIVFYRLVADTWLVGIIPVALYPFFGGKVWCRYWCPLAKMMELMSAVYARLKVSRFAIQSSDKCIACGECTRNCQVGIDVMRYALEQRELNNANSSCIGCGICVTVCPMDVLSFGKSSGGASGLVQIQKAA